MRYKHSGPFSIQARGKMIHASREQLEKARNSLGLETVPANGMLFWAQQYDPLQRRLNFIELGGVDARMMKQALIDQADAIQIKGEMTLREFMATEAFQALTSQLGHPFVEKAFPAEERGMLDLSLHDPQAKKLIAEFYAEVILSVSPSPMSYYIGQFHKVRFKSVVSPLQLGDIVFKRTHGFNPLALIQMMVELGELRYKDEGVFRGAFEPLPPQEETEESISPYLSKARADQGADWETLAKGAAVILGLFLAYKYVVRPYYPKVIEWWNKNRAAPSVDVAPLIETVVLDSVVTI